QAGLAGEIDPPSGEAGPRDQDRDAHLHGLDDHLRGEPPSGVEDLPSRGDTVEVHVAGDLVDRVVPADILHIEQWPVLLAQDAAMDRPGGEIEARGRVDLAGQRVEPRGAQYRLRVELDLFEFLHQIAKNGALCAARG